MQKPPKSPLSGGLAIYLLKEAFFRLIRTGIYERLYQAVYSGQNHRNCIMLV